MKVTVMQFAYEGSVDSDFPPRVFEGHLDEEQCRKLAVEYGSGYPFCGFVECDPDLGDPIHSHLGESKAVFYANYSNDVNPPLDEDGGVERSAQANLEVWFYHVS